MSAQINAEVILFLRFIHLGLWMGASYQLLQKLVKWFSFKKSTQAAMEFFYGPIWSLQYYYMVCKHHSGMIRWYMVVGAAIGFVLCYYGIMRRKT